MLHALGRARGFRKESTHEPYPQIRGDAREMSGAHHDPARVRDQRVLQPTSEAKEHEQKIVLAQYDLRAEDAENTELPEEKGAHETQKDQRARNLVIRLLSLGKAKVNEIGRDHSAQKKEARHAEHSERQGHLVGNEVVGKMRGETGGMSHEASASQKTARVHGPGLKSQQAPHEDIALVQIDEAIGHLFLLIHHRERAAREANELAFLVLDFDAPNLRGAAHVQGLGFAENAPTAERGAAHVVGVDF